MFSFLYEMNKELSAFDTFVDELISSDENLLKGELDLLLMQYLFNSLDLENIKDVDNLIDDYLVA